MMIRISVLLAATITLAACGGEKNQKTVKKDEVRQLDPNPPMSASDIDSIVKETRDRDASRSGKAEPPAVDSASNTTN